MTRNNCITYFKIVGNFNPDEVSELLNLTPGKDLENRRSAAQWYDVRFCPLGSR